MLISHFEFHCDLDEAGWNEYLSSPLQAPKRYTDWKDVFPEVGPWLQFLGYPTTLRTKSHLFAMVTYPSVSMDESWQIRYLKTQKKLHMVAKISQYDLPKVLLALTAVRDIVEFLEVGLSAKLIFFDATSKSSLMFQLKAGQKKWLIQEKEPLISTNQTII